MVRNRFSASGSPPFVSRRTTLAALTLSAALVTCWTVKVNARQATPAPSKTQKSLPPLPSSTHGKSTVAAGQPAPPSAGDKKQIGHLVLSEGMLDQPTGLGTGHNFIYTIGDTVITGDNARYDRNLKVLDADSHLVMDDPQHHVTGDKSHVDEKKALLTVDGSVVLTLKPEAAAPNVDPNADPNANIDDAKRQGAVVTCDHVDSYYQKKFHILRGHLVFKQHVLQAGKAALDRTGTAEHAEYDAKKEVLTLFPPVHVEDSDGKNFDSEKDNVIVITKKGKENVTGKNLKISFPVDTAPDDSSETPAAPVKTDTAKPGDTPQPNTTTPNAAAHPNATKNDKTDGKS